MSYSLHHDTLTAGAVDSSWADWCALVEESNQLRQSLMQVQARHHRELELAQQQLQLVRAAYASLSTYSAQLRAEIERLDPANRLADPALQPGGSAPQAPSNAAALRQCLYVSRARVEPTAVPSLWASCVRRNAAQEITGMLLFTGRHFAQLLEGEADTLTATLARIKADPRHERMRVLIDRPLSQRSCPPGRLALLNGQDLDSIAAHLLEFAELPVRAAGNLLSAMRERGAKAS